MHNEIESRIKSGTMEISDIILFSKNGKNISWNFR